MKNKYFLTIDKQIELLKSRNLKINDENKAKFYLKTCGYQNFINGYNDPFMSGFRRQNNKYWNFSEMQEMINLFNFDRTISRYILSNIQNFERYFNSSIVYCISEKLNEVNIDNGNIFCIDDESVWDSIFKSKFKNRDKNVYEIFTNIFNKSRDNELLKRYKNVQQVPIWSLFIYADFGSIIKLFNKLSKQLKENIIDYIFEGKQNINVEEFVSICKILKNIRNKCCHNNVLYNFESNEKQASKFLRLVYKFPIKKVKLFQIIQLLDDWPPFKKSNLVLKISEAIKKYIFDENINHISAEYIIKKLGFQTKVHL